MGAIYRRKNTKIKVAVLSFIAGVMFALVIIGGYICISI